MKSRTARKPPRLPAYVDGARIRLLARIHVMAKELSLGDESYRDVLERITTHRTAAVCDDRQLYDVVKEFERLGAGRKRDGRPMADAPMALRARALWASLFNLDEIDNGSERTLAAFVKRQTGKEDMRFCNASELSDVIDGLKAIAERAGFNASIDAKAGGILAPKRALVRLQWGRLHRQGWARVGGDAGLAGYAHGTWCTPNARAVDQFEAAHLDRLASKLGPMVRELKLGQRRVDTPES